MGDPDTTFITVPNIPLLTGFSKIRDMGWGKGTAANVVKNTGLGTPFINVSFSGLLWGYNDELPCMNLARPEECGAAEGEIDIFAEDADDGEEWGDDDWKRKKRSAGRYKREERREKREERREKREERRERNRWISCGFMKILLLRPGYHSVLWPVAKTIDRS